VVFTTSITPTTYTFTGTDGSARTGTSGNVVTTVPPASKYLITSSASSVIAGETATISAQLADANGTPVATSGVVVTWTKTGAGGTFATGTSTTDANGIASVVFTTGTVAGTAYSFTATDNAARTGTGGNLTTTAGAVASYIVTRQFDGPPSGPAGSITAGGVARFGAQLVDVNNNPVKTPGLIVNWTSTNGGTFSAQTSTTGPSGVATIFFTASTTVGTVHVITATTGTTTGSTTLTTTP
jgi:hypothetical protein